MVEQRHVCALKRNARLGNAQAQRILPTRAHGTLLLTTLHLGHVAVNPVFAYMLKRGQHMLIVTNEVGAFLGIITFEETIQRGYPVRNSGRGRRSRTVTEVVYLER